MKSINNYLFSTDKNKLQLKVIHDYLSKESYWSQNLPIELIKESFSSTNLNVCFLSVDEILEKIKKTGVGSLSTQEKEKLDKYSQSI